jgi:ABC-type multidrug transport system ATPase subunit
MTFVRVEHFSKSYGAIRAVEDFGLSVEKGEILALAGPDGAGKTTLFRALAGLIRFDAGSASIAGLDVATQFERIKPLLGYMPQIFSLYVDLSVEENLRFYSGLFGQSRKEFDGKKEELYQFSGLGPFRKRWAGALSGGMKQKLALSCALVHDPEVLLLDEPTTGVDPLSRRQFWQILARLRDQGSAIIVSTPYMDEVGLADRAVFIYNGRHLAEGTPEELTDRFNGTVFLVETEVSSDALEHINALSDLEAQRFGASLHLYAPVNANSNQVKQRLAEAGISAGAIERIQPDLEDTFVQLMSR